MGQSKNTMPNPRWRHSSIVTKLTPPGTIANNWLCYIEAEICLSSLRHKMEEMATLPGKQSQLQFDHGNRIVNANSMLRLINVYTQGHKNKSHDFDLAIEQIEDHGLGCILTVSCRRCTYVMKHVLYETGLTSNTGRPALKTNLQLAVFLYKSPISFHDLWLLFASIEWHAPSEKHLKSLSNKCGNMYIGLNEEQMAQNCWMIRQAIGNEVIVMTDTVYNNPPKGRAMNQPGTQCHTPMLEVNTGLSLWLNQH